jgi:signal transduction histidine kinase
MLRSQRLVSPAIQVSGGEPSQHRFGGRSLLLVRIAWSILALLTLCHLAFSLPTLSARFQTVCSACLLTPSVAPELGEIHLSPAAFATYLTVLAVLFSTGFIVVGFGIFWRRSDDRVAAFVAFALVAFGGTSFAGPIDNLTERSNDWQLVVTAIYALGQVSIFLFFYLFPDGRFTPRWMWVPASIGVLLECWIVFSVDSIFTPWRSMVATIVLALVFGLGVYTQAYKYRRVSSQAQRQQTKWVILGMALAVVAQGVELVIFRVQGTHILTLLIGNTVVTMTFLLIPISIGVAILRHQLFDVDLLINRTLVYAVLTVGVVVLYVLLVGTLSAVFQGQGNILISLLATGIVAVVFQPLRERLQYSVNRLFYGHRDEPYVVISRLSRSLEAAFEPDAVLPAIVQAVATSLKLPYTAISIGEGSQGTVVSSYGNEVDAPLRMPLVYQAEILGELIVAPRGPGESWASSDQRLLEEVARHAGIAVHAVQSTIALRSANKHLAEARERLVTAREEERRRLRRDLHDGLGPSLAALTLKVGVARKLLRRDQAAADILLAELTGDIEATVDDIRRLVYALRPPTLDQLGLVEAIRECVAEYGAAGAGSHGNQLGVLIDAPERLPDLPAALEVAAYRIAQEAFTNVVRHAHAHTCRIRLTCGPTLELEIIDDGSGFPSSYKAGIGLVAMRERAAELNGTCSIDAIQGGGTRVLACFPVTMEARDA